MLIFFLSNEEKINDLISKKYTKFLFILLIVYFIYQNYNFTILALVLVILIFLNVNIKEKFENNNYLKNIINYSKIFTSKELFKNNNDEDYDVKPYFEEKNNDEKENKENVKPNLEPFKNTISEIRELYNNIKEQINKLN